MMVPVGNSYSSYMRKNVFILYFLFLIKTGKGFVKGLLLYLFTVVCNQTNKVHSVNRDNGAARDPVTDR